MQTFPDKCSNEDIQTDLQVSRSAAWINRKDNSDGRG